MPAAYPSLTISARSSKTVETKTTVYDTLQETVYDTHYRIITHWFSPDERIPYQVPRTVSRTVSRIDSHIDSHSNPTVTILTISSEELSDKIAQQFCGFARKGQISSDGRPLRKLHAFFAGHTEL